MSTRRFEYKDEKSNKFWEMTIDGSTHTTRYGRMGTDGQTKTKSFDSIEAAQKDADNLIAQKTKKGYAEISDASNDPAARLQTLLQPLCSSDDDRRILNELCTAVVEMTDDTIIFNDDMECEYQAGGTVAADADLPQSFGKIGNVVQYLYWDGGGPEVGFALDDDGMSSADGWMFDELRHDSPEECARVEAAGSVEASFLAGQNALFFDPTTRLKNGEPGMAFVSHEGGGWDSVKSVASLDYGQILLRMMADAMIDSHHIPEIYF